MFSVTEYLVILLVCTVIISVSFIAFLANYIKKIKIHYEQKLIKYENEIAEFANNIGVTLPYNEVMSIVDATIDAVWKEKYLLYYRLKEITVIANMDEEITTITKEIINAFDKGFLNGILKYFTLEYFTQMITRKVQLLIVDYTNTYKPNTK